MKKENSYIVIENKHLKLRISECGIAESLVSKETGEELLDTQNPLPFCSLTEERPFNNEIKLAHPNKRMRFCANRVRIEDSLLYVGFELVLFEAVLEVCEREDYITLRLVRFNVPKVAFGDLSMDTPPVESFRLLELPFKKRACFGEWLNAVSDEKVAAGILATSPCEDIDSYKTKNGTVLFANALQSIKMCDSTAALVVSPTEQFLDCIARIEEDFDLPRGVESRRNPHINRSALWSNNVTPANVDDFIALARDAGLTHMLLYYSSVFESRCGYGTCGNYREEDLRKEYVNGFASLREMLRKIKDAGITPGIHFLHTHIGIVSRYVTPVADHRLRLKTHFTLSRPIGKEDTVLYVEEPPRTAPMHKDCRVLRFGGEIISYEGYTTEPPYCFTGCRRGYYDTNITPHEMGQIGGVVDVCEYSATSVYLDQDSSLQDEIAEQLAHVYGMGFEFIYFDGSEGTSAPFNVTVSSAQYRVIKRLPTPPLFCEGAAKTHFGWHYMSGGNAFDIFPAPVFKEKIVQHPFEEAPRMAQDFTRLNFGWWAYNEGMQPDIYEYGNKLAFSYDCPSTVMMNDVSAVRSHPRSKDILEVFRRWEEARVKGLITEEEKLALRDTAKEHVLLINEEGKYELCEYTRVEGAAHGNEALTAYLLERKGKTYVLLSHNTGVGTLTLPLTGREICYEAELGGGELSVGQTENGIRITVDDRHYLSVSASLEEVARALRDAVLE